MLIAISGVLPDDSRLSITLSATAAGSTAVALVARSAAPVLADIASALTMQPLKSACCQHGVGGSALSCKMTVVQIVGVYRAAKLTLYLVCRQLCMPN